MILICFDKNNERRKRISRRIKKMFVKESEELHAKHTNMEERDSSLH